MRIVLDPEELNRFAAFTVEAADDHAARAERLRTVETPPMPPELAVPIRSALDRVAADLDGLSAELYSQALVLRMRAAALDPVLRTFVMGRLAAPPE